MKKIHTLFTAFFCCVMAVNAANYDIKIAGITVTDANKTNVMSDGKVSYDPSTNTVTLDGANIDLNNGNFAIDCNYSKKLTIVLKSGSNNDISIGSIGPNDAAIQSAGPITITSEENPAFVAKLKIVTYSAPELYTLQGDIRIEGPIEVTLNGSSSDNNSGNVYNTYGGKFIIDGATVNMFPCRIRMDGTTITRSAITKPATAVLASDGRIIRSGTTTEFDNTTMVTVSSQLHKIYIGPNPQSSGHSVSHDEEQPSTKRYYIWAAEGQVLELWAFPKKDYMLTGWYTPDPETLIGTTNPYDFTVPAADAIVYAKFESAIKEEKIEGRTYLIHLINKTATITGAPNFVDAMAIEIPDTVTYDKVKYAVTAIAEEAFADYKVLRFIEWPASLQSIGKKAFKNCNNLEEISYMLPSDKTPFEINTSDNIFDGLNISKIKLRVRGLLAQKIVNNNLNVWKDFDLVKTAVLGGQRYLNQPDGTLYLTYGVWANNYPEIYSEFHLPAAINNEKITGIDRFAMTGTDVDLFSMSEYSNVTFIGDSAFWWCESMREITFSPLITEIRDGAFANCSKLSKSKELSGYAYIDLPEKLEKMGKYAFYECKKIEFVLLPAGLKEIGDYCFANCTGLAGIANYASEPVEISRNVFDGISNLSTIRLYVPYGCKTKYENADVWEEFTIIEMDPTGVDQVPSDQVPSTKVIENGVMYIKYKGTGQSDKVTKYNVQGGRIAN